MLKKKFKNVKKCLKCAEIFEINLELKSRAENYKKNQIFENLKLPALDFFI